MRYSHLVTFQGDDFNEALAAADEATAVAVGKDDAFWPGLYRGCAEWTTALLDYATQWDYGEAVEDDVFDTAQDEAELTRGTYGDYRKSADYLLVWDTSYGWVSLYRRYVEED